jgi:hypothetical protein
MKMKKNILIILLLALTICILAGETVQVSAESPKVCRGDHLLVSAQLLQNGSYGDPVQNQEIEFYDETTDAIIGTALTGLDGIASIDWVVPQLHPVGPAVINATFRGNVSLALAPSCQWLLVDIYSETQLEVLCTSTVLSPLDFFSCSVQVTNDIDDSLIGVDVHIFGNGVLVDSKTTNSTGHVDFDIECSPQWCVYGENVVEVVYELDSLGYNYEARESLTVTVEEIATQITLLGLIDDILLNDTINVHFILDSQEGFLSDTTVVLLLDDLGIEIGLTNSSGFVSFQLDIDERFSIGEHQLTVRYEGSFRYSEASLTIDISVSSPCVLELVLPDRLILGSQAVIELEGLDLFRRPLALGSVTLLDNSTGFIVEETASGHQPFRFILPIEGERGTRDVVVNITGNSYITNRTLIVRVVVWLTPEILVIKNSIEGYASLGQEIEIEIKLMDGLHTLPYREIDVVIDDVRDTFATDSAGMVIISWTAPVVDGQYSVFITYQEDIQDFLTSANHIYTYIVSREIPLKVDLDEYEVLESLQEILVHLTVKARNGTSFSGIGVSFVWLGHQFDTVSQTNGSVELHLSVPTGPGAYNLTYQTHDVASLVPSSGYFIIIIRDYQAYNSQGVGIIFMIGSSVLVVVVSVIPVIRRKQLLG